MSAVQSRPPPVASGSESRPHTVTEALTALTAGRPVVVDDGGAVGGHMVLAAAVASGGEVARMVRYTSGFLFAAAESDVLDRLDVPPAVTHGADRASAFAVALDASHGIDTGISGNDRATTLRVLATVDARPSDLVRPGHVVPVRTQRSGIFSRPRAEEAAVDLVRLADLTPVAALCGLVDDRGEVLDSDGTMAFAAQHEIPLIRITDLRAHRLRTDAPLTRASSTTIPTEHGTFTVRGYRDDRDGTEHLALAHPGNTPSPVSAVLAVHQECIFGEVFASHACPCRTNLDHALSTIAATGGVIVYARRASASAPKADLGDLATQVLHDLGLTSVRILPPYQSHDQGAAVHVANVLPRHGITIVESVDSDRPCR